MIKFENSMEFSFFLPSFLFRGKKYYCNICEFHANYLLPRGHNYPIIKELDIIGAGKRNVDCPNCGSSDRDRLVYAYFQENYSPVQLIGKKMLHVAPEKALSKKLASFFKLDIIQIDNRSKGYFWVYGKSVLNGNLMNLPFESNFFDFIICNHVLEHVENVNSAISEIHRTLKPNGLAITQVPISNRIPKTIEDSSQLTEKQRIEKFGQFDHLRLFGADFSEILQQNNLTPDFYNLKTPEIHLKLKLNPRELILASQKL